jgi:sugar O-acyltransferase (sialic acid O-acetyltransferase NeuD family)
MSNSKNYVYIVCTGGHAKQVIDIFLENGYEIRGAFDDLKTGFFYRQVQILGTIDDIKNYPDEPFFCTLGDNHLRKKICDRFKNVNWINCISSKSHISPMVKLGIGNYVGIYSIISGDTIINNFNIINDGATVTHDNSIGSYNHIAPNASLGGRVSIGDLNLVGTNATINPGISLGSNTIIGSGGVVTKSLDSPGTYVGVPCKPC